MEAQNFMGAYIGIWYVYGYLNTMQGYYEAIHAVCGVSQLRLPDYNDPIQ